MVIPGTIDEFRHLNGSAPPELLSDNPAPLEYADGVDLSHAAYPPIYLVLRWKGMHYTLANRLFPAVVLVRVEQKKKLFLKAVQEFQDPQSQSPSWDYLVGDAIGIYADLASIGQGESARRWLLEHLPTDFVRRQFSQSLPGVDRVLAKLPGLVTTDQRSIIIAPE